MTPTGVGPSVRCRHTRLRRAPTARSVEVPAAVESEASRGKPRACCRCRCAHCPAGTHPSDHHPETHPQTEDEAPGAEDDEVVGEHAWSLGQEATVRWGWASRSRGPGDLGCGPRIPLHPPIHASDSSPARGPQRRLALRSRRGETTAIRTVGHAPRWPGLDPSRGGRAGRFYPLGQSSPAVGTYRFASCDRWRPPRPPRPGSSRSTPTQNEGGACGSCRPSPPSGVWWNTAPESPCGPSFPVERGGPARSVSRAAEAGRPGRFP